MKKRNFLLPVASLLSVLSASDVDASVETKSQILDKKNETISSPASIASNPFGLLMEQSSRNYILAYHTSHASHASHRSHSSHYSSR